MHGAASHPSPRTLQGWYRDRGPRGLRVPRVGAAVARHVHQLPEPGRRAGGDRAARRRRWRVLLPPAVELCCRLTWISTGQLNHRKRVLRRTVTALAAHVRVSGLVVGLEPSCATVFRSDADTSLSATRRHRRRRARLRLLRTRRKLRLHRRPLHQPSLRRTCPVPALRRSEPGTLVLTDGFSCRTQIIQIRHPGDTAAPRPGFCTPRSRPPHRTSTRTRKAITATVTVAALVIPTARSRS